MNNTVAPRAYLLTIAYDGTNYAGWQRQENAVAVQEKVEIALGALLECDVRVTAAGRTDSGVHALGQRVGFKADNLKVPLNKLPMVLNGLLPGDISVSFAEEVPLSFSPRFDAVDKTYSYRILNAACPNPLLSRYSAFFPARLDVHKMKEAAKHFVGRHDFAAFCATGSSAKTTVREIYCAEVRESRTDICGQRAESVVDISVTGNAFLYNMVRIIAGTLVYVGIGKICPSAISEIILSKSRKKAGKTMPPHGLTLIGVSYPQNLLYNVAISTETGIV